MLAMIRVSYDLTLKSRIVKFLTIVFLSRLISLISLFGLTIFKQEVSMLTSKMPTPKREFYYVTSIIINSRGCSART